MWPNLKRTKQKKSLKGEKLDPNFRVTMEKCVTLVFDFRSYLGLSTFFSAVVAPLLAGRGIGWSHCSAVRGDLVFQSVTKQSGPSALECFDIFFCCLSSI